jgi:hypothetical protein
MSKLPLLALPFNSNLQVWRKYTAATSCIGTLYVWNIHAPIAQPSWPPDSLQWIKPFLTNCKIRIPLHHLHDNSTFRVPAVHHKNLRCSSKRVCDLLFHIFRLSMKISALLKSMLHLLTPDSELFCKNCTLCFSIIHRPVVCHLLFDSLEQHMEISMPATSMALWTHSGTSPLGNCTQIKAVCQECKCYCQSQK